MATKIKKWLLGLGVLTTICSCTSVPYYSIYRLITLDPTEINPELLRVAIKSPEFLTIDQGDIVLKIGIDSGSANWDFEDQYLITVDTDSDFPRELIGHSNLGEKFNFYKLSTRDINRIKASQEKIKRYLEAEINDKAPYIGVTLLSGCKSTEKIPPTANYSVYFKTNNQSDFFVIVNNFDIRQLDLGAGRNLDDWSLCSQRASKAEQR